MSFQLLIFLTIIWFAITGYGIRLHVRGIRNANSDLDELRRNDLNGVRKLVALQARVREWTFLAAQLAQFSLGITGRFSHPPAICRRLDWVGVYSIFVLMFVASAMSFIAHCGDRMRTKLIAIAYEDGYKPIDDERDGRSHGR